MVTTIPFYPLDGPPGQRLLRILPDSHQLCKHPIENVVARSRSQFCAAVADIHRTLPLGREAHLQFY
jgi:hypothetical protein